eukprot:214344-Pleurochrysis_carterae.AAC.1
MWIVVYGSLTKRPPSHADVVADQVYLTWPFVGVMPNPSCSQSVIFAGVTRAGRFSSSSWTRASSLETCCSNRSSFAVVQLRTSVRIAGAGRKRAAAAARVEEPRCISAAIGRD